MSQQNDRFGGSSEVLDECAAVLKQLEGLLQAPSLPETGNMGWTADAMEDLLCTYVQMYTALKKLIKATRSTALKTSENIKNIDR